MLVCSVHAIILLSFRPHDMKNYNVWYIMYTGYRYVVTAHYHVYYNRRRRFTYYTLNSQAGKTHCTWFDTRVDRYIRRGSDIRFRFSFNCMSYIAPRDSTLSVNRNLVNVKWIYAITTRDDRWSLINASLGYTEHKTQYSLKLHVLCSSPFLWKIKKQYTQTTFTQRVMYTKRSKHTKSCNFDA